MPSRARASTAILRLSSFRRLFLISSAEGVTAVGSLGVAVTAILIIYDGGGAFVSAEEDVDISLVGTETYIQRI